MAIHANANFNVLWSMATIIPAQISAPRIGTNGTRGVLKGLFISGFFILMIQTPRLTRTNAKRVPKEVRSPAICPGIKAANKPTNTKSIMNNFLKMKIMTWQVALSYTTIYT